MVSVRRFGLLRNSLVDYLSVKERIQGVADGTKSWQGRKMARCSRQKGRTGNHSIGQWLSLSERSGRSISEPRVRTYAVEGKFVSNAATPQIGNCIQVRNS